METHEIPPEIFYTFSGLYPDLVKIFRETQLSAVEFFALSYIRRFGEKRANGEIIISRHKLGPTLSQVLASKHAPRVTDFLDGLADRGFIREQKFTDSELKEIYGDKKVRKQTVVLLAPGAAKLDEFNRKAGRLLLVLAARLGITKEFIAALAKGITSKAT